MLNKEKIIQTAITITITIIVGVMGLTMFGLDAAIYSGITSGFSVIVGKEYADSLATKSNWNWSDVLTGCVGVFVGVIVCITLYLIG
jgi:hypothetical protein